jgi:hypothetical protein
MNPRLDFAGSKDKSSIILQTDEKFVSISI